MLVQQSLVTGEQLKLLPEAQVRRLRALVLDERAGMLLVGMANPTDLVAFDELLIRFRNAVPKVGAGGTAKAIPRLGAEKMLNTTHETRPSCAIFRHAE